MASSVEMLSGRRKKDYAIIGSARGAADDEGWRDGVDLLSQSRFPPTCNR